MIITARRQGEQLCWPEPRTRFSARTGARYRPAPPREIARDESACCPAGQFWAGPQRCLDAGLQAAERCFGDRERRLAGPVLDQAGHGQQGEQRLVRRSLAGGAFVPAQPAGTLQHEVTRHGLHVHETSVPRKVATSGVRRSVHLDRAIRPNRHHPAHQVPHLKPGETANGPGRVARAVPRRAEKRRQRQAPGAVHRRDTCGSSRAGRPAGGFRAFLSQWSRGAGLQRERAQCGSGV